MTTHRRAWMLRAGVVGALVVGAAVAFPTPALADDPDVQITNLSPGTIQPGQQATLQFTVRNANGAPTIFAVRVDTFDGLSCQGDCNVPARTIGPGETVSFSARLVGGNVAAGQQRQGTVRVSAESATGNDDDTDERQVTVRGQEQQEQAVKQVSGKVKDATTGDPIEGALVALLDSQQHNCTTTTSSSGSYRFNSCDGKPIAVGELLIGVSHEDFEKPDPETKRVNGAAGQSVTVGTFGLKSLKAAATPTATASVPAAEESVPSDETTPEATGVAADNVSNEDSGGMGSWLLIIVGGLLVALGVGAIVLLVVRRKQDTGDPGMDDDQPVRPGGRTPVPGAAGVYHPANDATRIAGAGAAPTMMGRPSIADAPTMLQSPVAPADEFPDPYGAPLPPKGPGYNGQGGFAPTQAGGGYGPGGPGATSAYGAASGPANGYGSPTSGGPNGAGGYGRPPAGGAGEYGRPTSGSGYGGPSGPTSGNGYGGPNGPTSGSGYGGPNGAPAGGEYGRPTSGGGYGPPPGQGGYERGGANGYGGPAAPAPGGYGSPAAPAGPYAGGAGGRGGDDGYGGGRDYREPQGGGYGPPAGGGGYGGGGGGDRYDEPTGRWEGNGAGPAGGYGQSQPPAYESGPYSGGGGYRGEPEPDRGGGYGPAAAGGYDQGGYGPADGGYGRPAGGAGGGYDQGQGGGYGGQGGGGYGSNGYDQQAGYDPRGGYDQVPQQRGGGGGYDPRGGYDDQGAYYDDQAGPRAGRGGGPQQPAGRSERRSLDWLDD